LALNIAKAKDKARNFEVKNQTEKAIDAYLEIVRALEHTPELDEELALFNKLGDLYQKSGSVQAAVEMWERGAAHYAEGGFHNNAIALCNKILRNAPGRTQVYLTLAKLMLGRGFVAEAKQHLLEYAERMKKAGQLEAAFKALGEFADLSGGKNEEVRLMLAEQLKAAGLEREARAQLAKLYHEASSDPRRSRATLDKIKTLDPDYDAASAPEPKVSARPGRSSELVFLDLDEDAPPAPPAAPARPAARQAPPAPPRPAAPRPEPPRGEPPRAEPPRAEPPRPKSAAAPQAPDLPLLDLEPTSLTAEPPAPPAEELPIERSAVEFDDGGVEAGTLEGLTGAVFEPPAKAAPPPEFEPTAVEPPEPEPVEPEAVEPEAVEPEAVEREPIELEAAEPEAIELEPEPEVLELEVPETPLAEEAALAEEAPLVEPEGEPQVPELNLVGFGEEGAGGAFDLAGGVPEIDLEIEVAAAPEGPPDVATLEAQVADSPDDAQLHRSLGEALVETGARERGLEELDIALALWEGQDEWNQAEDVTDEVLRVDPNSVRHHQKRVEFAFRRNDRGRLIDAYLGLSDALMRSGALERARAVYQRVLEHDARNERALSALATLEPPPEKVKPTPGAKPAVAAPVAAGDFVDLGALVLDEPTNVGDARLRVQDEEPTGDEQRDFDDMLAQFKKGIEASLGAEDVQAHYDLGIAFKEMGLLDEAIAEFQKALRGAEGRLRTSEALGTCFFEKGQYTVASTVLRRAVETDAGGDEAKISLLYWLGRCEEEMGRAAEALNYYQRVFAVEIGFQDVSERVKALAKVGR
jgi:tetratricopeptide (TPR) repeat protein